MVALSTLSINKKGTFPLVHSVYFRNEEIQRISRKEEIGRFHIDFLTDLK